MAARLRCHHAGHARAIWSAAALESRDVSRCAVINQRESPGATRTGSAQLGAASGLGPVGCGADAMPVGQVGVVFCGRSRGQPGVVKAGRWAAPLPGVAGIGAGAAAVTAGRVGGAAVAGMALAVASSDRPAVVTISRWRERGSTAVATVVARRPIAPGIMPKPEQVTPRPIQQAATQSSASASSTAVAFGP